MIAVQTAPIVAVPDTAEAAVARTKTELKHRFGGCGCAARTADYARLLSGGRPEWTEEALHQLCEEGVSEASWLSDGTVAFYFPRR